MAIPYRLYDPSLLEPLYPQRTRPLEDRAVDLATKAGQLTQGLHPIVVRCIKSGTHGQNREPTSEMHRYSTPD